LIQLGATNVLTDPIWSDRASPFGFAGPRRWVAPGIEFDALPPVDVIIISHNHYDHLDDRTVRRLVKTHAKVQWVVPLGVAPFVRARGAVNITELDWWGEASLGTVTVTCAPAQHFSGRSLTDRNRTLWASWAMRTPVHSVYFGGDSGYHADFSTIGQRCGPFDLALIPIGAYDPRWFMRVVHMDPEEAVRAFNDVRTASEANPHMILVPIHWGTFKLTDEPMDEPPRHAHTAWQARDLPPQNLGVLAHGETRRLPGPPRR